MLKKMKSTSVCGQSHCYELEKLTFENAVLSDIPISYMITMHDSSRRAEYIKQLENHKPTKVVMIVHNMGYKNCNKPGVTKPIADLWHAHQFIADYHTKNYSHGHALIMEDDVQFSKDFRERSQMVQAFMRSNNPDVYSFGSSPTFTYPYDKNHLKGFFTVATAVVYSHSILSRFHELSSETLSGPHDCYPFWIAFYGTSRFMVRKPLAGQIVTRTENSKVWDAYNILIPITHFLFRSDEDPFQWLETPTKLAPCGIGTLSILLVISLVVGRILICRAGAQGYAAHKS